MISHCVNPDCAMPFHYLRGGRLYRFEIRSPQFPCKDVPNAICSTKPSAASVFFWLCETCSHRFSINFHASSGVSLNPRAAAIRSDAPVMADSDSEHGE